MPIATTTGPLTGTSGSLPVTGAAINAGMAALPIYAGPTIPGQVGAYITASPDFVGGFALQRSTTGWQADGSGAPQILTAGDGTFLRGAGPGPIANVASTNTLTLCVTACISGSVALSVVQ